MGRTGTLLCLYIATLGWCSSMVVWLLGNHDSYAWAAVIYAACAVIFASLAVRHGNPEDADRKDHQ